MSERPLSVAEDSAGGATVAAGWWERLARAPGWVQPVPLLAVVLWGGIYPGAKVALRDIPPPQFTMLRLALATMVIVALSGGTRFFRLPRGLWKAALLAGLAQALFQGLLVAGLDHTTAGNSAVLLAAAPVLAAVWLVLVGREHPAPRQWGGLALGLAGVALVVGGGVSVAASHVAGDAMALAAAGAWAWYGFAAVPAARALGPIRATGWSMLIAGVVFVPVASPGLAGVDWGDVSWGGWAGLVYGAVAGMVIAMSLWVRSMRRLGERQTMLYAYLEPVSAIVIAAMVLGESFGLLQAVGAALTFLGVWLAS